MAVGSPQGSLDVEPLIVGQMSKMRWSLQLPHAILPVPSTSSSTDRPLPVNNHQPQCAYNKDVNDPTTTDDLRTINDATSKPAPTIQVPFTNERPNDQTNDRATRATERPTNTMDDDDGET
ncbi:unnamed protein product [Fusarium fujikuroi]|uniref:Uncharacterized protein n=1 Tax=Fusarium fujikuroi TaxID=5127 RepID=A0A9Q9RQ54_FUSFU|nr:unnamed protein product [Fusarium fujikuroi]VTT70889.1 unnamed protein product [Fusarium fujikuroi]VZH87900.1 unnamed protein product [Fusarium fujikuroi]